MRKALAGAGVAALALALWLCRAGEEKTVAVPPGLSARETGRLLEREGVIGSPVLFKLIAKLTRMDRALKPGSYRLRAHMSSPEALYRLIRGRSEVVKIVIPEGFSARQIAERLDAAGVCPADAFLGYVRDNRLEGYLFPTTYFLGRNLDAAFVAHVMHLEFQRAAGPELRKGSAAGLKPEQALILASIVEREAVLPREKPMIASVYVNRMAKRMRLEADPTVQYALGYWKKGLSRKDLQADSPYNTYVHYGLPPGPICSAGLDSIRAALNPARTNALYFVADNSGGHAFSETFDEHLENKTKAARQRRRRGSRGAGFDDRLPK